jgi:hypothetical protein
MVGTRHPALALQFADVANIDQHGVIATSKFDRLLDRQSLYFALGSLTQGLVSGRDRLRHSLSPKTRMLAERIAALKPTG